MNNNFISFVMGFVFGVGLLISGMVNPVKVLGFLDVLGNWDPSLALVMAGALLVTGVSFRFIQKLQKPLCCEEFYLPSTKRVDARLIIGSALFGIGWGLAGICPGPAVVVLSYGLSGAVIFFISMLAGMAIFERTMGNARR